uniref:Macrofage activating glycoprotein n=1 Tax=Mycena chlorophos TaxID=658473 RepID=A0ABQ0L7Q2_MYCCL|nr:predicted protein [Mycena chlorophos]
MILWILSLSISAARAASPTYSATYLPSSLPAHTEQGACFVFSLFIPIADASATGQSGTNKCGTASNQTSECQNAYMNSVNDFCLWAPPEPGPNSYIGDSEQIEVSWCLQDGYGTRLIPNGTISGAHWTITPDYVQVTGVISDPTKLNIPANDQGGELDPHGADGNGNPVGGIVFSSAFGQLEQIFEWTNFMEGNIFCFRACNPKGSNPPQFCEHIYDVMGCEWNMPGNYDTGFTSCEGDSGEPMGVYGSSTFYQGQGATPAAHPAPATRSCTTFSTVGNALATSASSGSVASSAGSATPTPKPTTSSSHSSSGSAPASTSSAAQGSAELRSWYGLLWASLFALVGALLVL